MKKLFFLVIIAFTINACDIGSDVKSEYALLPVYEVDVPTAFKTDSVSVFTVRYKRPTDCYLFDGFYYDINGNVRTIGIQAAKLIQSNCSPDTESIYEVPLRFKPTLSGPYIFKFWLGTNEQGEDIYNTVDVNVE